MSELSLQISSLIATRIGLGTWALGGGKDWGDTSETEAENTLQAALNKGINLIDTAPIYGAGLAEERLGRAIKHQRTQVILATKCGISLAGGRPNHDLRPQSILQECEDSLRRLQTDYIDLYQIHWPDSNMPLADCLGTLLRLKEQGKIRAIGVCNFSVEQLKEALACAPISAVQGQFSLLENTSRGVVQFCAENGISFWAYGALGGGILSGKYKQMPNLRRCDARRYFYKHYFGEPFNAAAQVALRVQQVAQQKRTLPAAVALASVLKLPGVSGVLVGARTVQQVEQNINALHIDLTEQEQKFLWSASVK